MSWWNIALRLRKSPNLRQLAANVADRCETRVAELVGARPAEMSTAEARGYIRARSAVLLRREVGHELRSQRSLPQRAQRRLAELAADDLVWRILTRHVPVRGRVTAPLRRAA